MSSLLFVTKPPAPHRVSHSSSQPARREFGYLPPTH